MSDVDPPLSRVEPDPAVVEELAERLTAIKERIVAAGGADVTLVTVTKAHPAVAAVAAIAAGATDLGENYAQEFLAKRAEPGLAGADARWHFIGQLQSNKVRKLAGHVDLWHSLDRPSVIDEVAKRAPGAAVLIQVDVAGEPGKGGCAVGDTEPLVGRAIDAGLDVRGLMTVGPNGPAELARPVFSCLATMVAELGLSECSMGMTNDLEVAVGEGATIVRVGTAIMGSR